MSDIIQDGFLGAEYIKAYDQIRKTYKKLFELAEDLNHFCHEILSNLKPHRESNKEIIITILFIKALIAFQGIVILSAKGMINEAQMLLRCMIEEMFILVAIKDNYDFVKRYILSENYEKYVSLKALKGNDDWNSLVPDNIDNLIEDLKKTNKEKNIKKLRTIDIAEKSGLDKIYYPVYSILSKIVHSTPKNLEEYFTFDEDGDIKSINYGPTDKNIEIVLNTTIHCMITVLESVNDFYHSQAKNYIENFKNRHVNLSKKIKQL